MLEASAVVSRPGGRQKISGQSISASQPRQCLELLFRQLRGVLACKEPANRGTIVPIPRLYCPQPYRTPQFISLPETIKQFC